VEREMEEEFVPSADFIIQHSCEKKIINKRRRREGKKITGF
jgi:hypothetical protein